MSDQSHYEDEEIFSPTASGSEREMSDEIPVILATCTPNPSGGENDRIPRRLFQTCGKRPRSQTREIQFADITNKPDKRSKTADTTQLMILNEIQKANSSINNFAKDFSGRLDAFEKRLASVEQREFPLTPTSTDAGSSAEKVKRKVPTRVRVSCIISGVSDCSYIYCTCVIVCILFRPLGMWLDSDWYGYNCDVLSIYFSIYLWYTKLCRLFV